MSQEIKHKENDTRGMFYMEDDKGITSELTYTKQDNGVLVIDHTETRSELEGKGLASMLLKRSVEYAREKNYKIDPLCPFAEVKFDEHKEYRDVLAS
ncbi:GNAT family N-acetyltransferase [Gillisia hiemivivida]|jgi:predicted GNAT family acetyltransferase|uniref:N-acetyltransferase n=1 Tax=Gillisia hiemivivida TaxID=291190 RepID=A0A5C6ZPF2_9FLAO|nr:GNAT family N-acetyltransferase [Gillisia hiemivivida]TXD92620.1 N-acetyltransferase [Gillisia hiemivivida]